MPDLPPRLLVGCSWSWRYSKNQTAIFAPLTRVNTPHHLARGFDQARELDRARHSELIEPSACNRSELYLSQPCHKPRPHTPDLSSRHDLPPPQRPVPPLASFLSP